MTWKIAYSGDWHADRKPHKFRKSYQQFYDWCLKNKPTLICIPGDLTDGQIKVGDFYNELCDKLRALADIAPIYIVYGTPSHDFKGSLDGYAKLKAKHPIKVIDKPSVTWFTEGIFYDEYPTELLRPIHKPLKELVLYGFPYPIRSRFLDNSELRLGYNEQNKMFMDRMKAWCEDKENKTITYNRSNIPTVLVAHLQLEGTVPSYKQDMQSEYQKVSWFEKIANWGILGHIHNTSLWAKILQYTGSFYNKTMGETEDKFFFELQIDNSNNQIKIKNIAHKLTTPKLLKIECKDIEEYRKYKEQKWNDLWDLWFIIKASNRSQLDIEKEEKWWKEQGFIEEIKIELDLSKTTATYRTENYNVGMTILDKFLIWCKARNKVPTEFQQNKINEIV